MHYILSIKLASGTKYSTVIFDELLLLTKLKELIANLKEGDELSVITNKNKIK